MTKRVHQLAKELKISTHALKKHLADMGVEVKSHMSPVEDDVVEKIKAKFKQEVDAEKKREQDRKSYHERIVLSSKKKPEKAKPKKESGKTKADIPVFEEKEIRKTKKKSSKSTPKREKDLPTPPPAPEKIDKRQKAAKKHKKDFDDFEEKSKHTRAKLKHGGKGKKRKKKFEPTEIEEAEISKNIKKTLAKPKKKKKYKKSDKQGDKNKDGKLQINEFTSVSELAKLMDVPVTEIIAAFFNMGQMVTINQRLDRDSLEMICDEFDFDVEFKSEYGRDIVETSEKEKKAADYEKRPPVVTIMGHVDHGKTSILDYIRKTNIIAGESGGITQHIGAYQVDFNGNKITFLDTPGHEAFTAMRSRGANVTDLAIIVVAANEGVKPQTVEAIDHARAAGVPIIVAINKIDLKDANVEKTIADLLKQNLYLENYGGNVPWTTCSAKTGEGIEELLELIILAAEMKELKAPVDIPGKGTVIESEKDSRMGTVATILLSEGDLEKGDNVVCGATYGKISKMEDERGNEKEKIGPSDVAILYGLNDVPKAGDIINKVENEKMARQISSERKHIREEREKYHGKTNLNNLFQKIKQKEMSELKLIVKADTDGSVEALCDSFEKLSTDEVMVNIIRKAVGGINEADVALAAASDAIIIGFHVRASNSAKKMAENENVDIKQYQIIYEAIEDIQKALQGMLTPELKEKYLGTAKVKQIFKIKKVGTIAGCSVEKGVIHNDALMRLYRNDIMIHEGKLSSLKHYDDDVKEVKAGSECGIGLENYNDIKEGDIIEAYTIIEVERKI
jgi:translation initiation factor IF-2